MKTQYSELVWIFKLDVRDIQNETKSEFDSDAGDNIIYF